MSKFKSFDDIAAFITSENAKLFKVISELRGRVDSICTEFQTKINEISAENATLRTAMDDLQDSLIRQNRQNQIIIRNIPVLQNEKLVDIFGKLSKSAKFTKSSELNIYRYQQRRDHDHDRNKQLRTRSQSSSSMASVAAPPPIIVVNFQNPWDKSNFVRCCLKAGELNLTSIGFASPGRIYFGENLTKRNYNIFRKCSQMKKDNKILKLHTRNGLVYICKQPNSPFVPITQLEQLNFS